MSELDVICDMSKKDLKEVPECIAKMSHLKMLYLDRNNLTYLPEDMFQNLPNLSWLDLRDNQISEIPSGIANHKCLENILLQNNKIAKLPLEIATLRKLKVLQLSDNPVLYPPQEVVDRGIDDIFIFLQQEQYKLINNQRLSLNSETTSSQSSTIIQSAENRTQSGTLKLEILPTVIENDLNRRILNRRQSFLDNKCSRDKIHRVFNSSSKTTVHSYYKNMNVKDLLPTQDKRHSEEIKQMWLEKLKELVIDQERILQQEKNITALKNWRNEKRLSSKMSCKPVESKAPFDTNATFNKYMSRSDPTADINKALIAQRPKFSKTDVNTVIEDVMTQLARARENMSEETNPEERIKNAEHELQLIVNLHKKLERIQKSHFL